MSYELDLHDDVASAVRRAARDRLEKGAQALREDQVDDPVGAVHQARKEVKKSRSLLRLVRPALTASSYRRENRTLRDAARTVARVRDADVMVETVEALHERFTGQLPARSFTTLRNRLAKDAERGRPRPGEIGGELVEALDEVAARVDDWPLDGASWSTARDGIATAYKRGRKAFATADGDPSAENLHELRKRVKDLWYQERLLRPAWPAVLGAQADEAHALADLLGDDHDLAVLAERLGEDPPTAATGAVIELIDERRHELLAQVRALGRRVYAEKPKAFARRLRRYMRAAEAPEPAQG
ncbi:MAG: CHAD domain-containing protein [Gaiellaceae bacterium]